MVQQNNVLGVGYSSNFLETVNALGNIGPGASGSALFDQNNRVVGSLTLGRQTSDSSGYGMCPVATPPAPDGTNGVADFTALSAIWNSTADTTSTTGSATLKSVLDPGNTGTLTTSSVTPAVQFYTSDIYTLQGSQVQLRWNAQNALQCSASGGISGDGWAGNSFLGNAPGSASPPQPPFAPHVTATGTYTYTLTCTAGPTSVQQSVTVTFENNAPYVTASLSGSSVTYSNSPADYVTINWNSNVSGCEVVTSPNIPDSLTDPLAIPFLSQGSASLTPAGPGTYTISVACSIAGQVTPYSSAPLTLTVLPAAPPTASISVSPNPAVVGQDFTIAWSSTNTLSCVQTSNAAAWDESPYLFPSGTFSNIIWQSGQYTFSISCPSIDPNQGPATAQTQLTVGAIAASLSASPATLTTGSTVTITWSSTNATSCTASGGGADGSTWTGAQTTSGSVTQTATTAGTFTYALTCVNSSSSNTQATAATAQQTVTVSGVTASGSDGAGHGGSLSWIDLAMLGLIRAAATAAARSSNGSRRRTRNPDSGSRAHAGSAQ